MFSRLLDPLAVDFELPSGPSHPPKPNKTEHTTKNNNTSPAHILDAWQRGGFREAYGDPPRCSRLQGASIGVWNRALIESFRNRKLYIGVDGGEGVYTASHFESQRFPTVKPPLFYI